MVVTRPVISKKSPNRISLRPAESFDSIISKIVSNIIGTDDIMHILMARMTD